MCYGSLDEKLNPVIDDCLYFLSRSECQPTAPLDITKFVGEQDWTNAHNCMYSHYVAHNDVFVMPIVCI